MYENSFDPDKLGRKPSYQCLQFSKEDLEFCISYLHCIVPDKDSFCTLSCIYFLTHQFKHVFWVLKRSVSLTFFEYPQHMFWLRNKKNIFPVRTLNWRPDRGLIMSNTVSLEQ